MQQVSRDMTQLRIISGGQTGVDRAALDAAMARGIPCGGWCPAGRRAEDGPIADRYHLTETNSAAYSERTLANVLGSDATLILLYDQYPGQLDALSAGTHFTMEAAKKLDRPSFIAHLAGADSGAGSLADITGWIGEHEISVLNIAGPRESECPGIYVAAHALILNLLIAVIRR